MSATRCMKYVWPPVKARSGSVPRVKRTGAHALSGKHGVACRKPWREIHTARVEGVIFSKTSARSRPCAARETRQAERRSSEVVTGSIPASRTIWQKMN
eukprot:scaffold76531_cov31-Tisochrysis_lutea.AAC.4